MVTRIDKTSFLLLVLGGLMVAGAAVPRDVKPKQNLQQVQVIVVPPNSEHSSGLTPPKPGYIWVQIPLSEGKPASPANPPYFPANQPPVSSTQLPSATNLPYFPTQQPDSTSSSTTQNLLLSQCLTPRGTFPSNYCNKYVNCWDGVAVEQFCPESLVFNPKGYCDYPANVPCKGRPVITIPPVLTPTTTVSSEQSKPTTEARPTVITTLPTIDPALRKRCLKPRGQFRSVSCSKYVNCWDGVAVEQECPEGLLFSLKGYCDYSYNVDCQDSTPTTLPSRNSISPNNSGISQECPLDFGTYRDKQNCSNYYTCIGGKVVASYTCPEGFKFNSNIGVCDWEDRVDCTQEPRVLTTKSNFLASIPQDILKKINECEPGTVFPLNAQCTSACLCRYNVSEVVQCPEGLAYDAKTDKCRLPQLAKC